MGKILERAKGGEIMVNNIVKYFQPHPTAGRYSTNCKLMKKSFFISRQYMRKQRHQPTKLHIVKPVVFLVVTRRCERRTTRKRWTTQERMLLNCGAGEDS